MGIFGPNTGRAGGGGGGDPFDGNLTGQLTVSKSARTGVVLASVNGTYNPNVDNANQFNLNVTGDPSVVGAWDGTPADGQGVLFKVYSGGALGLTFNASYWRPMVGVTIPATAGQMYYVTAVFNALDNIFDVIGATQTA